MRSRLTRAVCGHGPRPASLRSTTLPRRKSGLPDLRTILRNPGKPRLRGSDYPLDGRGKIRSGKRGDARSQLIAQQARLHLGDFARRQIAKLEGPERYPDKPVHGEPEMAQHLSHFAVLAFPYREGQPDVLPLHAI